MAETFDMAMLLSELSRDEGRRLKPYLDTVGKTTIGVGRNLTDVGISEDECDLPFCPERLAGSRWIYGISYRLPSPVESDGMS